MTVIALTREIGALDDEIAAEAAARLGLRRAFDELPQRLAGRMKLPEDAVVRCLEGRAGLMERWGLSRSGFSLHLAGEILQCAARGGVLIQGWGAPQLLRTVSHVVCVRVCAPLDLRVARLMERPGTENAGAALREIHRSDAAHHSGLQQLLGTEWEDPYLYDLVVNSGRVSVAGAVEQIVALVDRLRFRETPASRLKLAQMALWARVRCALRDDPATAEAGVVVDASPTEEGRVTLRGVVLGGPAYRSAERIAWGVEGVTQLDNQLRVMPAREWAVPPPAPALGGSRAA